ncbi:MAG TPA: NAD(P) transhydrogenase subunit alpha, partial [Saprospiraceae bacterium]|nr:NAD(P) transhydrogenase subunit alpha [Saprospiraceae bacterium]
GILSEEQGEQRVALTPDAVPGLLKSGFQKIMVERGAGSQAFFSDAVYQQQGATVADRDTVLQEATFLARISPPDASLLAQLQSRHLLIGQMNPLAQPDLVTALLKSGATAFSLDMVPRSTRAQAMDVLSSMATVAGYKAVLLAATHLPTFFPMMMTAAGTIKPAKVLILGAGVAGLQAISTARRLGAVVEAFDVRAAAKEEVLSLGAKFVEVAGATDDKAAGGYAVEQTEEFKQRQAQAIHDHAVQADVVICTAQIPGRRAPLLLRTATVEAMKSGAVVVDLAASSGGNCEVTQNAQTIRYGGVTVIGNSALPSSTPKDASGMFSKNVINFLKLFFDKSGAYSLNFGDDIIAAACVTHEGQVVSERVKGAMGA